MDTLEFKLTTRGAVIVQEALASNTSLKFSKYEIGSAEPVYQFDPANPIVGQYEYDRRLDVSLSVVSTRVSELSFVYQASPSQVLVYLMLPEGTNFIITNILIYVSLNGVDEPFMYLSLPNVQVKRNPSFTILAYLKHPQIYRVIKQIPIRDITSKILTHEFLRNKFYYDLFDVTSKVLDAEVVEPRRSLQNIREITGLERKLALRYVSNLGVNFLTDKLTDKDIERLGKYVSLYYPVQSTKAFNKFLGFFLNARLDILQLFSTMTPTFRYGEFFEEPQGPTIVEGGEWFATSHVQIEYDAERTTNLALPDLISLFYTLAPIHLVIERIVANLTGRADLYVVARGEILTRYRSTRNV